MIEAVLLVLAVVVGVAVVMRMDVEPRDALPLDPAAEPAVMDGEATEAPRD